MAADTVRSPAELEGRRIQQLLEGRNVPAALAAAEELRKEVPENRDVLYLLAVALRYSDRIPEALATLAELGRLHPRFSRLYQERGHCCVGARADAPT